jgi:cell division septal protein FtsQ
MRKRRYRNAPGILLALVLIALLGYFLGWSKALEIRSIEISASGNEAIVTRLLIPKDIHIGLQIARVSSQRIAHDLSALTWVDSVKVDRRWLAHDLRITITEHHPIAQYIDTQGATEYFDAQGYNFTTPNPPPGLPVINFATVGSDSRAAMATFLSQTPADLTAHLSSLSVDQGNLINLTTSLPGYKELAISWGATSDIPLKIRVLRQLLALPENKRINSVDLSNPLSPIVK